MPTARTRRRAALAEAQNWRCAYCGGAMQVQEGGPCAATIEHVQARSQGGSDARDNLVAACRGCNEARLPTLSALRFFEIRQSLLAAGTWPCCEPASSSTAKSLRALQANNAANRHSFRVDEALDHLLQHHPGCPPEFRNELAHLVARRRWRDASLGQAIGIVMTDFVSQYFIDLPELCGTEGLSASDARAIVSSKVSQIIGGWRCLPVETTRSDRPPAGE